MKKASLVIMMVCVFALSGCGVTQKKNNDEKPSAMDTVKDMTDDKTGGMMSKIETAMKTGAQIKCTHTDENGSGVVYIKGKKYRAEYTMKEKEKEKEMHIISLYDGEKMYTWSDEDKSHGMQFSLKCQEEMMEKAGAAQTTGEFNFTDAEGLMDELKEKGEGETHCTVDVSAVDYTAPKDVEFVDQCEVFKQVMENAHAPM